MKDKKMWGNPPTTPAREAIVFTCQLPLPANYYGMDGCQWNARCWEWWSVALDPM